MDGGSHIEVSPGMPRGRYRTPCLPSFKFPPDKTKAKILEIIEEVRQCNVSEDIAIPELVVCGKQSSGKSSVLEALTGLELPKGDGGPCTRFVIEIRLFPGAESNYTTSKVRFRPTPEDERTHGEAFEYNDKLLPVYETTHEIIEEAKKIMGITDKNKFSPHVLSIEYHFPDPEARSSAPRLTLVDLPGLVEVEDGAELEKITSRYIRRESSFILAVVDAVADPETHKILQLAKKFDPNGRRTFGIITKPDMVSPGSKLESVWVHEVLHLERWFKLGVHVIFNRDPVQIQSGQHHLDLTRRQQQETTFFQQPRRLPPNAQEIGDNRRMENGWNQLYKTNTWGIENLRDRLVALLSDMATNQLGSIYGGVEMALKERTNELNGMKENNPQQVKTRLAEVIYWLRRLAFQASSGDYREVRFFDISRDDHRWLRSRIAAKSTRFAEKMRSQGHDSATFVWKPDEIPPANPQSKDVDQMLELLRKTRSGSHPADFNPDRINLVLGSFSKPWKGIAIDYLGECYACCEDFLREAVYFAFDERRLAERFLVKEVIFKLKKRKELAQNTLELIEKDRVDTPMSMSPEMWMGIRDERVQLAHTLSKSLNITSSHPVVPPENGLGTQAQVEFAELEIINRDDALKLLQDMLKRYKKYRDTYIDNIIVQVVQRNLLRDFDALFVHNWLNDEATFSDIVADPNATQIAEKQTKLNQDIDILSSALEELKPLLGNFSH